MSKENFALGMGLFIAGIVCGFLFFGNVSKEPVSSVKMLEFYESPIGMNGEYIQNPNEIVDWLCEPQIYTCKNCVYNDSFFVSGQGKCAFLREIKKGK